MTMRASNPDRQKPARRPRRAAPAPLPSTPGDTPGSGVPVDPFRAIRFPNAIRERRRMAGFPSLLSLAHALPAIPYIRLSKIERGEVVAKADELRTLAATLQLDDPEKLLVDVEAPDFSIALWAGLGGERPSFDREDEERAMLLAAAFRARRASDPTLTLARLQTDHGLAAVIVSRIENAARGYARWNATTLDSVAALLGLPGRRSLPEHLETERARGALDEWLRRIPGAAEREAMMRTRIADLRRALRAAPARGPNPAPAAPAPIRTAVLPARLTVMGVPIGNGLIDPYPNPQQIAPPPDSGPNSYALRMGRATLGAAIPASAVLIVDPDRTPLQGGLAVLKEEKGLRVLIVTTDRDGRLIGYSRNPEREIPLDAAAPATLATVTAILLA